MERINIENIGEGFKEKRNMKEADQTRRQSLIPMETC